MATLNIYRTQNYSCSINKFENLDEVDTKDIKLVKRNISGKTYIHAEPRKGNGYMFGGNFISTSNGVVYDILAEENGLSVEDVRLFPAIPLHDRQEG